jgi:hypothetical protein
VTRSAALTETSSLPSRLAARKSPDPNLEGAASDFEALKSCDGLRSPARKTKVGRG